jgi:hypothetical protein
MKGKTRSEPYWDFVRSSEPYKGRLGIVMVFSC